MAQPNPGACSQPVEEGVRAASGEAEADCRGEALAAGLPERLRLQGVLLQAQPFTGQGPVRGGG